MTDEQLAGLEALLTKVLPISTRETPDYAELFFGKHQTQAMTMDPDDWNAIGKGLPAIIATARASAALEARVSAAETEGHRRATAEIVAWLRKRHVAVRAMREVVYNDEDRAAAIEAGAAVKAPSD